MRRTSRIVARGLLMAVVTHLGVPGDSDAQTLGEAIAQLRSGSYDEALSALREIALGDESDSGRSAAYVAYMAALAEVGRYDDALDMGTEAPGGMSVAVANTLGEILYQVGRVEEAREAFARSIDGSAASAVVCLGGKSPLISVIDDPLSPRPDARFLRLDLGRNRLIYS